MVVPNQFYTITVPIPQGQDYIVVAGLSVPFTPTDVKAWTESGSSGVVIWASADTTTLSASGVTFNLSGAPIDNDQILIATFLGYSAAAAPAAPAVQKPPGLSLDFSQGALSSCGMRYHELALQHWLNKLFLLRWGVPMPVIFASPMDAFSEFTKLWSEANNPYLYLTQVKDASGAPLYLPYPSPPRYPIISVFRRNYKLRQSHNFSIHRMRHLNWPTVADAAPPLYGKVQQGTNLQVGDLGNVTTSRYPMAFDYRFQLDFFCNRPDTQAFFLRQLFNEFWRTGGTQMQTWTPVVYPLLGTKLARIYLDGEIENMTPEVPEDGKNVEFRVSATVVMEGYDVDVNYKIYPALWSLLIRSGASTPAAIAAVFAEPSEVDLDVSVDMRDFPQANPTVANRIETTVMPSSGTYWPETNGAP